MQSNLEFNLDDPIDKERFDAAPNGFRYKRLLEDLVQELYTDKAEIALARVQELAKKHSVPEIGHYVSNVFYRASRGAPNAQTDFRGHL